MAKRPQDTISVTCDETYSMWPWKNLNRRIWLYRTLATALDAGLGVDQALDLSGERLRPSQSGDLVGAVLHRNRIPDQEVRVLRAAETAGVLPQVLNQLVGYLEARVAAGRKLAIRFLYPTLLLHAAVLLPNLRWLFLGGMSDYLGHVIPTLIALWVFAAVALLVIHWGRTLLRTSAGIAKVLRGLPVIGKLIQYSGAGAYANLFSILLAAGVPLAAALKDSACGCGNAELEASGLRIREHVANGGDALSDAFYREIRIWPPLLTEAIRTGEAAGRLEETLAGAARGLRQESGRRTEVLLTVIPMVVYLAVAGYVAWVVITTFTGLYSAL